MCVDKNLSAYKLTSIDKSNTGLALDDNLNVAWEIVDSEASEDRVVEHKTVRCHIVEVKGESQKLLGDSARSICCVANRAETIHCANHRTMHLMIMVKGLTDDIFLRRSRTCLKHERNQNQNFPCRFKHY